MFFLFICLGSEEYLTSHGRAAENMTKMIKKNHIFRSHCYWHFQGSMGGTGGRVGGVISLCDTSPTSVTKRTQPRPPCVLLYFQMYVGTAVDLHVLHVVHSCHMHTILHSLSFALLRQNRCSIHTQQCKYGKRPADLVTLPGRLNKLIDSRKGVYR